MEMARESAFQSWDVFLPGIVAAAYWTEAFARDIQPGFSADGHDADGNGERECLSDRRAFAECAAVLLPGI